MRVVREPTSEEQAELERMLRQEVGRVALRAQMVLLSARGYSAPEISTIQGVSDVTVYSWLERFDAEGPAGLYDRPRPGRPPNIDTEAEQCLLTALERTPEAYGYPATIWTTPLLRDLLRGRHAVAVCADTVRRTLHALGYRWRRPCWAIKHTDPDAAYRLDCILHALETATLGTVCLVQDETKFRTLPPLRRMWMRQGRQVRVPTPKQNHHVYSYGALDLATGEWQDRLAPKANSATTLTFLNDLLSQYPRQRILLIWDQASYHTSTRSRRGCASILGSGRSPCPSTHRCSIRWNTSGASSSSASRPMSPAPSMPSKTRIIRSSPSNHRSLCSKLLGLDPKLFLRTYLVGPCARYLGRPTA